VLLLSTRLSPSAVQSLLAKTGCLAVLASPRHIGAAKEALTLYQANEECPVIYAQAPYRTFTKPESTTRQRSLLDDTSGYDFQHAHGPKGRISQSTRYHDQQLLPETPRIATKYHYGADTDRNVFILHSSGTTGLPKAIPQAHRYLMSLAPLSSFESDSSDYIVNEQKMAFSTLPLFHCFGLMAPMLSLSIGKPFAIPPSGFIPTALSTVQFISMVTASTLMVVPSILQDIAELPNDQGIDALKSLQYIACGGGALSPSVGEKLVSAGVKIINGFGGTEVGSLGILQPPGPDRDWKCFRLRQDLGCTVKEIAPAQPGEIPHYRISVRPPGWTEDFEISDFFVTSAKRPGQDFQPIARADDVLVLKTGEKVQPHVLETMLSDRADIRAALAFGDGQFEIGVMIEPAQLIPSLRIEEFKVAVWPTIIEAGKVMDAHAQVSCRDAVVVLGPGQKFPRSAKGSVLRKTAYEQFREEIEAVYTRLETPSTTGVERTTNQARFHVQPPSPAAAQVNGITNTHHANGCAISAVSQGEIDRMVTDIAAHLWQPDDQISAQGGASQGTPDFLSGDIEQKLLEHVQAHIWKPHAGLLNNTEDLFELGMDSLQAVQLRRFLIAQLSQSKHPRAAAINVPKDILYTHSSIAKIAAYLLNRTIPPRLKQEENVFQSLLEQYVSHSRLSNPVIIPSGSTILLTGGTGALGCHLVSQLASGTPIDRIICLNRINIDGANPYARQFKSSKEKGAHIPLSIIDKVEILETNTSLPYLGLAQPVYWGLASAVTHIIHNAWPVDFKRTITSFESQFSIMANLLDLARDAGSRPQFMFVSSIAVVAQYSNNTSGNENPIVVPEAPFQPHWPAPTMGYGQAKLVCEKMLERAVDDGIVDGVIARCGQISGSVSNGYWNSSEYFPTLIRNSQRVGALPDLDGVCKLHGIILVDESRLT
jgi:nucleoside-diphosphate-sugar epimerase